MAKDDTHTNPIAPKTSMLGWDMDHVWLLRRGRWRLQGERRGADGQWSALRALVEVEGQTATFRWEGPAGPVATLELSPDRAQNRPFHISVHTSSSVYAGRLETRGARQFLVARDGQAFWNEILEQKPDGSVDATGIRGDDRGLADSWHWILRPEARTDPWTIPASVVAQIESVAKAGAPVEQCGLLVGRPETREIVAHIGMVNVDQSEDHFTIDSREQFKATKSLRGSGTEVVGSWHSHPFSPARLSDEDMGFAQDDTALYAVLSLMDPDRPALNIWQVADGAPALVELRIARSEETIHQDTSEERRAS